MSVSVMLKIRSCNYKVKIDKEAIARVSMYKTETNDWSMNESDEFYSGTLVLHF